MAVSTTVETKPLEPDTPSEQASAQRSEAARRFWFGVASAVALGAAVRFTYLFHGGPSWVKGDGFGYHLLALRVADGLGYTVAFGSDVGAENAHHPPGWTTVLASVAEAGGRSMRAHQVTGLVIGLGVILLAGLVGRRYVGLRVGVLAALLAAIYPGFWVLEAQILSEPLGLLVLGVLMLVLADLWQRPTLAGAVVAGVLSGALALVRSEQLALLVIAVVPLVLLNPRLGLRRRFAWTGAATAVALLMIAPWTIHNLGRFEEPVLLSTNGGNLLLLGNCPSTYGGELMGFYDTGCLFALGGAARGLDRSQVDVEARKAAFENMGDNLDRLPATVLARYGRLTATFRTTPTVEHVASWFGTATWPVWAWVSSFWLIAPLAVYGSVLLRRSRTFQWPLVAPVVVVVLVVTVSYGEPRYHTPADLGIVVLAAVALDHVQRRVRRATSGDTDAPTDRRQALGGHSHAGTSGTLRTRTSTGPA
ncbi:MAG: ArnT family glycosyltransferase [Acidimicrobiales bacterium]